MSQQKNLKLDKANLSHSSLSKKNKESKLSKENCSSPFASPAVRQAFNSGDIQVPENSSRCPIHPVTALGFTIGLLVNPSVLVYLFALFGNMSFLVLPYYYFKGNTKLGNLKVVNGNTYIFVSPPHYDGHYYPSAPLNPRINRPAFNFPDPLVLTGDYVEALVRFSQQFVGFSTKARPYLDGTAKLPGLSTTKSWGQVVNKLFWDDLKTSNIGATFVDSIFRDLGITFTDRFPAELVHTIIGTIPACKQRFNYSLVSDEKFRVAPSSNDSPFIGPDKGVNVRGWHIFVDSSRPIPLVSVHGNKAIVLGTTIVMAGAIYPTNTRNLFFGTDTPVVKRPGGKFTTFEYFTADVCVFAFRPVVGKETVLSLITSFCVLTSPNGKIICDSLIDGFDIDTTLLSRLTSLEVEGQIFPYLRHPVNESPSHASSHSPSSKHLVEDSQFNPHSDSPINSHGFRNDSFGNDGFLEDSTFDITSSDDVSTSSVDFESTYVESEQLVQLQYFIDISSDSKSLAQLWSKFKFSHGYQTKKPMNRNLQSLVKQGRIKRDMRDDHPWFSSSESALLLERVPPPLKTESLNGALPPGYTKSLGYNPLMIVADGVLHSAVKLPKNPKLKVYSSVLGVPPNPFSSCGMIGKPRVSSYQPGVIYVSNRSLLSALIRDDGSSVTVRDFFSGEHLSPTGKLLSCSFVNFDGYVAFQIPSEQLQSSLYWSALTHEDPVSFDEIGSSNFDYFYLNVAGDSINSSYNSILFLCNHLRLDVNTSNCSMTSVLSQDSNRSSSKSLLVPDMLVRLHRLFGSNQHPKEVVGGIGLSTIGNSGVVKICYSSSKNHCLNELYVDGLSPFRPLKESLGLSASIGVVPVTFAMSPGDCGTIEVRSNGKFICKFGSAGYDFVGYPTTDIGTIFISNQLYLYMVSMIVGRNPSYVFPYFPYIQIQIYLKDGKPGDIASLVLFHFYLRIIQGAVNFKKWSAAKSAKKNFFFENETTRTYSDFLSLYLGRVTLPFTCEKPVPVDVYIDLIKVANYVIVHFKNSRGDIGWTKNCVGAADLSIVFLRGKSSPFGTDVTPVDPSSISPNSSIIESNIRIINRYDGKETLFNDKRLILPDPIALPLGDDPMVESFYSTVLNKTDLNLVSREKISCPNCALRVPAIVYGSSNPGKTLPSYVCPSCYCDLDSENLPDHNAFIVSPIVAAFTCLSCIFLLDNSIDLVYRLPSIAAKRKVVYGRHPSRLHSDTIVSCKANYPWFFFLPARESGILKFFFVHRNSEKTFPQLCMRYGVDVPFAKSILSFHGLVHKEKLGIRLISEVSSLLFPTFYVPSPLSSPKSRSLPPLPVVLKQPKLVRHKITIVDFMRNTVAYRKNIPTDENIFINSGLITGSGAFDNSNALYSSCLAVPGLKGQNTCTVTLCIDSLARFRPSSVIKAMYDLYPVSTPTAIFMQPFENIQYFSTDDLDLVGFCIRVCVLHVGQDSVEDLVLKTFGTKLLQLGVHSPYLQIPSELGPSAESYLYTDTTNYVTPGCTIKAIIASVEIDGFCFCHGRIINIPRPERDSVTNTLGFLHLVTFLTCFDLKMADIRKFIRRIRVIPQSFGNYEIFIQMSLLSSQRPSPDGSVFSDSILANYDPLSYEQSFGTANYSTGVGSGCVIPALFVAHPTSNLNTSTMFNGAFFAGYIESRAGPVVHSDSILSPLPPFGYDSFDTSDGNLSCIYEEKRFYPLEGGYKVFYTINSKSLLHSVDCRFFGEVNDAVIRPFDHGTFGYLKKFQKISNLTRCSTCRYNMPYDLKVCPSHASDFVVQFSNNSDESFVAYSNGSSVNFSIPREEAFEILNNLNYTVSHVGSKHCISYGEDVILRTPCAIYHNTTNASGLSEMSVPESLVFTDDFGYDDIILGIGSDSTFICFKSPLGDRLVRHLTLESSAPRDGMVESFNDSASLRCAASVMRLILCTFGVSSSGNSVSIDENVLGLIKALSEIVNSNDENDVIINPRLLVAKPLSSSPDSICFADSSNGVYFKNLTSPGVRSNSAVRVSEFDSDFEISQLGTESKSINSSPINFIPSCFYTKVPKYSPSFLPCIVHGDLFELSPTNGAHIQLSPVRDDDAEPGSLPTSYNLDVIVPITLCPYVGIKVIDNSVKDLSVYCNLCQSIHRFDAFPCGKGLEISSNLTKSTKSKKGKKTVTTPLKDRIYNINGRRFKIEPHQPTFDVGTSQSSISLVLLDQNKNKKNLLFKSSLVNNRIIFTKQNAWGPIWSFVSFGSPFGSVYDQLVK